MNQLNYMEKVYREIFFDALVDVTVIHLTLVMHSVGQSGQSIKTNLIL